MIECLRSLWGSGPGNASDSKIPAPQQDAGFTAENGPPSQLAINVGPQPDDAQPPDGVELVVVNKQQPGSQGPIGKSMTVPPPLERQGGQGNLLAGDAQLTGSDVPQLGSRLLDSAVLFHEDENPARFDQPPLPESKVSRPDLEVQRALSERGLLVRDYEKDLEQLDEAALEVANRFSGTAGPAHKAKVTAFLIAVGGLRDFFSNTAGQSARHAVTQAMCVWGEQGLRPTLVAGGLGGSAVVTAGLTLGDEAAKLFCDAWNIDKGSALGKLIRFIPFGTAVIGAYAALGLGGPTLALEMVAEVVGRMVGCLVRDTISQVASDWIPGVELRKHGADGLLEKYSPEELRSKDLMRAVGAMPGYVGYYVGLYEAVAQKIQLALTGSDKPAAPGAGFLDRFNAKSGYVASSGVLETADAIQLSALYAVVFDEMAIKDAPGWRGSSDLFNRIAQNAAMRWNNSVIVGVADVVNRHNGGVPYVNLAMKGVTGACALGSELRGWGVSHGNAARLGREDKGLELMIAGGATNLEARRAEPKIPGDHVARQRLGLKLPQIEAHITVNSFPCRVSTSEEDIRQERETIEVEPQFYHQLFQVLSGPGRPGCIGTEPKNGRNGYLVVKRDVLLNKVPSLSVVVLPRQYEPDVKGHAPVIERSLFFAEQKFLFHDVPCKVTKTEGDHAARWVTFTSHQELPGKRYLRVDIAEGGTRRYTYRMDEDVLRLAAVPFTALVTQHLFEGARVVVSGHHCEVVSFRELAGPYSHGPRITLTSLRPVEALERAARESALVTTRRKDRGGRTVKPTVGDLGKRVHVYEMTPAALERTEPLKFGDGTFVLGRQEVTVTEDRRTENTVFRCAQANAELERIFPGCRILEEHEDGSTTFAYWVSRQLIGHAPTVQELQQAITRENAGNPVSRIAYSQRPARESLSESIADSEVEAEDMGSLEDFQNEHPEERRENAPPLAASSIDPPLPEVAQPVHAGRPRGAVARGAVPLLPQFPVARGRPGSVQDGTIAIDLVIQKFGNVQIDRSDHKASSDDALRRSEARRHNRDVLIALRRALSGESNLFDGERPQVRVRSLLDDSGFAAADVDAARSEFARIDRAFAGLDQRASHALAGIAGGLPTADARAQVAAIGAHLPEVLAKTVASYAGSRESMLNDAADAALFLAAGTPAGSDARRAAHVIRGFAQAQSLGRTDGNSLWRELRAKGLVHVDRPFPRALSPRVGIPLHAKAFTALRRLLDDIGCQPNAAEQELLGWLAGRPQLARLRDAGLRRLDDGLNAGGKPQEVVSVAKSAVEAYAEQLHKLHEWMAREGSFASEFRDTADVVFLDACHDGSEVALETAKAEAAFLALWKAFEPRRFLFSDAEFRNMKRDVQIGWKGISDPVTANRLASKAIEQAVIRAEQLRRRDEAGHVD